MRLLVVKEDNRIDRGRLAPTVRAWFARPGENHGGNIPHADLVVAFEFGVLKADRPNILSISRIMKYDWKTVDTHLGALDLDPSSPRTIILASFSSLDEVVSFSRLANAKMPCVGNRIRYFVAEDKEPEGSGEYRSDWIMCTPTSSQDGKSLHLLFAIEALT